MSTPSLSRREVLAVTAVTVSLPMVQSALGTLRQAAAAGPAAPGGAPGGGRGAPAPAEKAGWFATTKLPADLKDGEFASVEGHPGILLTRSGKTVVALTSKCTHKGCTLSPTAGQKIITCKCHKAQFNLDGTVAHAPAKDPLAHFAIRVNDKGLIEIDPGQKLDADAKDASLTIG
jgi:cytochrome b6-f complex iron-sulfur subunit